MVATNATYANMPYWNVLPMMYTNFGGDTQICTVDPYTGYDLQCSYNPYARMTGRGQFPPIFGGGYCNYANPFGGGGFSSPYLDPNYIRANAQKLLTPALNSLTSQNINQCINTIAQTKARLQALLLDDKTTEAQKDQIEKMIEQLKEQEERLQEIMNSDDLDPQTAHKKVSDIEADVNKLVREILKKVKDMKPDESNNDDNDDDDVKDTDDGSGSRSRRTEDDDDVEDTRRSEKKDPNVDKFTPDVQAAVDQFYYATYCWGTVDDKMEEVLNLVNSDNVMDLMLAWNKYHSTERGESFMKAFMWDADSGQKETYGKAIASALRIKAEELGVFEECREDFAKIDKEMGSWLYISNDIYENYDNIIRIIAEKMGSKYGSPTKS